MSTKIVIKVPWVKVLQKIPRLIETRENVSDTRQKKNHIQEDLSEFPENSQKLKLGILPYIELLIKRTARTVP